jgi:hypothetical protein
MRTLTPTQYEALELGYERANHLVAGTVQTVYALHERGLVTDPVNPPTGGAYAYLTTAGLDLIESGG